MMVNPVAPMAVSMVAPLAVSTVAPLAVEEKGEAMICGGSHNLGAGGGGILRDHQGNINMAFQTYFGNCSNNMAEGLAILKGLQWCATNLLHNVIIETDSMIMVDTIKGKDVMMWQMQDIVMQITKIMKEGNFQINHCFREANSVADALANIGVTEKHEAFFTSAGCLPRQVKVALKNDQDGLPNIKIRVRKGHFNFLT